MPRKSRTDKDYCKPGETLERGIVLSDKSLWAGRFRVDVFWKGSRVSPEITAACLPGDYLDVWPELNVVMREKLRRNLIGRLNKGSGNMTIVNIDTAGDEQEVRDLIADHQGEIVRYVAEGPAGGNPNWTIRFKDVPRARQFVKELYDEPGLPNAEIDELYITQA